LVARSHERGPVTGDHYRTLVNCFTIEKFQEALNESFVLHVPPTQQLKLQLVGVEDLTRRFGGQRPSFAATFRGPMNPWARQHTYEVENARLGRFHLFIVPTGPDARGMLYEATFS
jgi:hypothetical protein